jgi:hypothetical protein
MTTKRPVQPSPGSANRIPLYIALFVAVAALAMVGLRLTRQNVPVQAAPAAAPADPNRQPFQSETNSSESSRPEQAPAPPPGERLNG